MKLVELKVKKWALQYIPNEIVCGGEKALDKKGIAYQIVDMAQDLQALEYVNLWDINKHR